MRKLMLLVGCLFLATATAHAAIVLNPVGYGTDVVVSGSGAPSNGPVELLVNGDSRGSVYADMDGKFYFMHQNLSAGDKILVQAALVFNFNTPGDAEGWTNNGHTTKTVENGLLKIQVINKSDPNFQNANSATFRPLDGKIYRVMEIRMRNNSNNTAVQFFIWTNTVAPGNPGSSTGSNPWKNGQTGFETYHIALSDMFNGTNQVRWSLDSVVKGVRIDPTGATGSGLGLLEIDYIRISEGLNYEFNYDGDLEYWPASGAGMTNSLSTATVSGGALNLDVTGGDPFMRNTGVYNWPIDQTYYKVLRVGGTFNAATPANTFEHFWSDKGGGWAVAGNFISKGVTMNNAPTTFELDYAALGGSWNATDSPANSSELRFDPIGNGVAGDKVKIDYLRLGPANPYGPVETVVTSAPGPKGPLATGWPIQCVYIPAAGTKPTIDGVINEATEYSPAGPGSAVPLIMKKSTAFARDPYEWNFVHRALITDILKIQSDADLSAKVYFLYDDQALYIAVDCKDSELLPATPPATGAPNPNAGDCFQALMDYDNKRTLASATDEELFYPTWGAAANSNDPMRFYAFFPTTTPPGPNPMTGTTYQVTTSSLGYVLETRIPWTAFTAGGGQFTTPFPPPAGHVMAIQPTLMDRDTDGAATASNMFFFVSGDGSASSSAGSNNANLASMKFVKVPIVPVELSNFQVE